MRPSDILTRASFDNAIATLLALGGSTNAMIHVIAMARRAGMPLGLADFEPFARRVPVLSNLKLSGEYLMEDFFEAGGLRALLANMAEFLDLSAKTVSGRSLGETLEGARMSGSHFGTVVLHISSESAVGGPFALVRDGDFIEPDVDNNRIHLDISDEEMQTRRLAWVAPPPPIERGWGRLFHDHVTQAHEGCDFPFLMPGAATRELQL